MEPHRAQPVATGGKWEAAENGSDKRKALPCVATARRRDGKEQVDGSSPSERLADFQDFLARLAPEREPKTT
jgi:hypothetical protein